MITIGNMAYRNILVVENDIKEIPLALKYKLKNIEVPVEYWYNFKYSFHFNSEENYNRLENTQNTNTLLVSNPSFVGVDNRFEHYVILFLKLKELNIKLNFAVLYTDNFYMYLLKFLANESNITKKENNHKMLKEILDFHIIYEIDNEISDAKHITYESLIENYIETHRRKPDQIKIKETGEIYDAYYINYSETIEESYITLKIPNDYNNQFKLNEIEKV